MSRRDVAAAPAEVLILTPCGFDLTRARSEAKLVRDEVNAVGAARVVVLDGSAYFNGPASRLVDSLELLVTSAK